MSQEQKLNGAWNPDVGDTVHSENVDCSRSQANFLPNVHESMLTINFVEEILLTDMHTEQNVVLTGRNRTGLLARRAVSAAPSPTHPAAGPPARRQRYRR